MQDVFDPATEFMRSEVLTLKPKRSALCLACLLLLVPLLIRAWQVLPLDRQPLIEKKYAGWSGVLRLWVFEGWLCGAGSVSSWLNRCVAGFEKDHPGVYVQPQYVDSDTLADFYDSGIQPPDMLLFPPGLLRSPEGLVPVGPPAAVRPELTRFGLWEGTACATPVAMGGYMWAWNPALIDDIPADWRECDGELAVPEPETWRRWDAALLALCAGRRAARGDGDIGESETLLPGMDLGLELPETPVPAATAAPDAAVVPCRLPAGFAFDGDAWRSFINGEAAAMPVTQREIRRLQQLSEQGRGPDWQLRPADTPFTDQLLVLGISARAEGDERPALCRKFLDCMLGPECQGDLCRVGAFGVTDAPSGYLAGDPLAALDASLRTDGLLAPNCFDTEWPDVAKNIVREFIDGSAESTALWRQLEDVLG